MEIIKKKILFIYGRGNQELLNRQSALGSYIACLLAILNEAGHEIQVNDITYSKLISNVEGAAAVANPSTRTIARFIPSFIKNYLKDQMKFKQLEQLKEKIEQANFNPDLIFEFYNYGSQLGYYFSKKLKCPLVLIYDAPVLEEYEFFHGKKFLLKSEIRRREERSLLEATKIIVYSNSVKNFVQSKIKKLSEAFVIHQNVDFTRFEIMPLKTFSTKPTIGFIGSFLKWHNVDLLLDAFIILRDSGNDCKLLLIGNGQEIVAIKEKVAKLKYKDDVSMPGFVDGDALRIFKEQINIGVMPGSNWYGAPNKIFEYGAAGMAVIAPDTPTIKDLFNESELMIFKLSNLDSLVVALKALLANEQKYNELAKNLQTNIMQTYSKENTLRAYSSIIQELIQ